MKTTDNHPLLEIDRLVKPATSTMIDRYIFANHWTKNKKVIDAATGKGYGAGILLSLGAKSVTGIENVVKQLNLTIISGIKKKNFQKTGIK